MIIISFSFLKRFNIFWLHILVATVLFTTTSVAWAAAIAFFGSLSEPSPIDKEAQLLAWLHLYAIWPIIVYIVFFTRPYIPFRKRKEVNG